MRFHVKLNRELISPLVTQLQCYEPLPTIHQPHNVRSNMVRAEKVYHFLACAADSSSRQHLSPTSHFVFKTYHRRKVQRIHSFVSGPHQQNC